MEPVRVLGNEAQGTIEPSHRRPYSLADAGSPDDSYDPDEGMVDRVVDMYYHRDMSPVPPSDSNNYVAYGQRPL